MEVEPKVWMVSRRNLLWLAAGGILTPWARLDASNSDFWNKKDPAQWSSDEIDKLTTKSPWAKEVSAAPQRESGGGGYDGGGNTGGQLPQDGGDIGYPRGGGVGFPGGGGVGLPRIGGIGGGGMGGGRRRQPGGEGRGPQYKGVVRWESAQPLLEALKTKLPEGFENHYVISVSGIPLEARRRRSEDDSEGNAQNTLDHLKAMTSLQPKGKEIAQAGVVRQQPGSGGPRVLFGFSRETLRLRPEDKQVTFETRMGGAVVKATFNLKDMMYHGQLAV